MSPLSPTQAAREAALPLGSVAAVLEHVGDARLVLVGEATHGTREFYAIRADITSRLIEERGFTAVAVEADWPDALRVNRYVRGERGDQDAGEALGDFVRFPPWMWRNTEVTSFVDWLRSRNEGRPHGRGGAGFYGLDLYSLYASVEAVVGYLQGVDPEAAALARARYGCLEQVGRDAQRYGYAATSGALDSCEDDVVRQLAELRAKAEDYLRRDGRVAEEELFYAEQNARVIANAEAYYRTMYRGGVASWNLRDRHMAETLEALVDHLEERDGRPPKVVVWEHNSHVGDARATEVGEEGELNVGQLARERLGDEVALVGFTTFQGTVTAASDWGGPAERKRVRPGIPGSYEDLFHQAGIPRFALATGAERVRDALAEPRLERAIGVVYRPETERRSHYFHARLGEQFDVVIHVDETTALEPLERTSEWVAGEPPETYPHAV